MICSKKYSKKISSTKTLEFKQSQIKPFLNVNEKNINQFFG